MLLVYAKKHTGLSSLDWDEAVEEALCFGWIDSRRMPLDADFFLQIFTPRKPKSRWSGLNKKRVVALIEAGLMAPAGHAAIDLAKKTGAWAALEHVDAMVMPPDLKKALAATPGAAAKFKGLTPGRQKQFLYFMNDAKKEETRVKRIAHILKTLIPIAVLFACGLASACGGSPAAPSSSSGSSGPGYAGQWSGSTTQGRPVSFTISADQKLTALSVGYAAGSCTGTKTYTGLSREFVTLPNYPGPVFGHETHAADGTDRTEVTGWFTSSTTATGVALFIEFPGCGSGNGNWSATKR